MKDRELTLLLCSRDWTLLYSSLTKTLDSHQNSLDSELRTHYLHVGLKTQETGPSGKSGDRQVSNLRRANNLRHLWF